MRHLCITAAIGVGMAALCGAVPRPGDVYREFHVVMGGPGDWRVTQPGNPKSPRVFLPNPVLRFEISTLQGARRAEIQIDRWGGHTGTIGKQLRLNGNPYIALPELTTTPPGKEPQCYVYQDNPIVEVPLPDLREGANTLEGMSGGQAGGCGNNWGQWGWYGAIVRVFYDPSITHPQGRIASPTSGAVLKENPVVKVDARGPNRIDRVDVLAYYDGIDEDGDGIFEDWHSAYRHVELQSHAGTVMTAPFQLRWDTTWVPDQAPKAVKLVARIRDATGVWTVTPAVEDLTLTRSGMSVKVYKPREAPPQYQARAAKTKTSKVVVPDSEALGKAVAAVVALRTWNGYKKEFQFNGQTVQVNGADHKFAYGLRPVPVAAIRQGENVFSFHHAPKDHGIEVLWPGPALLVRYGKTVAPAEVGDWLNPDYSARIPIELAADTTLEAEKPVEIGLNFTEAMRQAGISGEFDHRTIRVVDIDQRGIADAASRWQFDRAPQYDAGRNATGTLTVLIKPIRQGANRRLMVYFATTDRAAPRLMPRALVSVTDEVEHQGQPSVRVSTTSGEYVFHKQGAGFASLYDRDGNDWISYRPGNRTAGEYRGLPNLGLFFHPGYSGKNGSHTIIESRGPLKARLRSVSQDGTFACMWDFFPTYARMTLERAGQPFWFLYEGTPGGVLEPDGDYWVTADGAKHSAKEFWTGNLAAPEWVYFGDSKLKRVLFLANHQNDAVTDQYRPINSDMTVFGFGRKLKSMDKYMTAAPARFTIGFAETADFAKASSMVNSAWSAPQIKVGRAEAAPRAAKP